MSCKWLSVEEAAQHLHVNHSTVYRWCKQGKLTYVQIERKILVCKTIPEGLVKRATTTEMVKPDFTPEVKY